MWSRSIFRIRLRTFWKIRYSSYSIYKKYLIRIPVCREVAKCTESKLMEAFWIMKNQGQKKIFTCHGNRQEKSHEY